MRNYTDRGDFSASVDNNIILHIIRKPNSVIVLFFIQYISNLLLLLLLLRCRYSSKKVISFIQQYFLRILAFVPFSFSKYFAHFVEFAHAKTAGPQP